MHIIQTMKRWALPLLIVTLMIAVAEACPTCKDSVENDSNMVQGYFWSIIFMMSTPFLILGGLFSYLYWQVVKAKAKANQPSLATTAS